MRNGCLTRSVRLAENKHNATHTNVFPMTIYNWLLVLPFQKVLHKKKRRNKNQHIVSNSMNVDKKCITGLIIRFSKKNKNKNEFIDLTLKTNGVMCLESNTR